MNKAAQKLAYVNLSFYALARAGRTHLAVPHGRRYVNMTP